jgi:tetratricopeptide (TPR) repeat protein
MKKVLGLIILSCFIFINYGKGQQKDEVKMREEYLTLPTYVMGPNDVNPEFFRNESYQGASRVIYPYPMMDNFTNNKENKTYKALYLENEYISLCILPELGGKLFYATDKTNNYEIFYRQHVIKPAHIGMLGAWISGGVEWCVFHHHRASTFLPVDYSLVENPDGSKTIWFGETEPRQRMKWTIGITLYPGKSYIEATVKLMNPTAVANSILYWANVATHANENYQVIFPPSVQYGVYHAKNSFSHWPVTTEIYNNYDYYKDSIDASWWKNHPKPISFFAFNLKEGFLAGYDFGKNAGTIHIADPYIAAGAKLWEWGPGPEGSFWDTKVLTDSDGPYAELMAGAFSDNQPDYSWIKPFESKQFKQFWFPLRDTKGVKNANLNGCVNLIFDKNKIMMAFNTTTAYRGARVMLNDKGRKMYEETINIDPANPYYHELQAGKSVKLTDLRLSLLTSSGEELVAYQPVIYPYDPRLPDEVRPPKKPSEISTNEELYFTGIRIKQFHNAQLNALEYFNEALKRDSFDTRCNIELGLDFNKRGLYAEAANHFRRALARPAKDYTRPLNCEALYYLGSVLIAQAKYDDAYDTLYRATWDYSYRSAACLLLSRISCTRKNYVKAEEEINNSLETNSRSTTALNLKAAILRKLGKFDEAFETIGLTRKNDELDTWCRYESYTNMILGNRPGDADGALSELKKLLRNNPESYLELVVGYMNAGFDDEAEKILMLAYGSKDRGLADYPLIDYYLGYLRQKAGDLANARMYYDKAEKLSPGYCNPFRLETINILDSLITINPNNAMAHYYLGNLLYDRQPVFAITEWKNAVELKKDLSIGWRNLGWGNYYTLNDVPEAIKCYETAIAVNPVPAKYYYELDNLYEENNSALEKRLRVLLDNHEHVVNREDALTREIWVLILNGQYDQAVELLTKYYFHAQEGTRNLHDIYVDAHLLRGINKLKTSDDKGALTDFKESEQYPENQQIGRDPEYLRLPQIYYYIGLGYIKTGDKKSGEDYFRKVLELPDGNDWHLYYRYLVLKQTRKDKPALELLEQLKARGDSLINTSDPADYFAKFGYARTDKIRKSNGYLSLGLYYLEKGDKNKAKESLDKAIELNISNAWAEVFLKEI